MMTFKGRRKDNRHFANAKQFRFSFLLNVN